MVNNSSRRELMKKVQEADFFALDLQLYLNTHPDCSRALTLYQDAVQKAKELRKEYERIGFHLQRLYKRRKISENGEISSNWSSVMEKRVLS